MVNIRSSIILISMKSTFFKIKYCDGKLKKGDKNLCKINLI